MTLVDDTRRPGDVTAPPLLSVNDLSVRFDTARGVVHAVDRVSCSVRAGETLGIVGESGSGKSVFARAVMRLTPPHAGTEGEILFDGQRLDGMSARSARDVWGKRIAMIFQDPMTSLNPVMRIGPQISESLVQHLGVTHSAANKQAIDLLIQVGIPEPARRMRAYPHELSGGMRQRVAIAIAIACDPELVFADEPTTALDVTIQRQILDLLRGLQKSYGMALVLISHDLAVVARRTDRTMVMYGGRVAEEGPTRDLFKTPRHPYTAALLSSIPRLRQPAHTRLAVIPGRPADVIDPEPGCRFAPRCSYAQPRCLREDPVVSPPTETGHVFRCLYPIGTEAGDAAFARNVAAGHTAAGLALTRVGGD